MPASPVSFTFTLSYPAGMTGNKVLSGIQANFTDDVLYNATAVTAPNITLTPAPTPVAIDTTGQPANQTVTQGQTATFTVTATGTSPTYAWKKGTTPLTDSGNISGSATATLTIVSAQPADEGSYTVTVSNAVPSSVTSTAATLTVNTPATISTPPTSQSTYVGTSAIFSVVAAGKPTTFTYQWIKGATDITSATNASYTVTNPQLSDSGTTYSVRVSNGIGTAVTSNAATLTVNLAPVAASITTQPTTLQTVLVGANVSFTVVATGVPSTFTYQWKKGGTAINGATTDTLQLSSVTANDAGSYTVTVSNTVGTPVTSGAAVLVVNVPPAISAQPQGATVTKGATVTFSVTATGTGPFTYQWMKGALVVADGTATGATISGSSTATLTIANAQPGNAGAYRVTVSGAGTPATSTDAMLTVQYTPVIDTQPTNQSTIVGTPVTFAVAASGVPAPSFQWKKGTNNISGATNASYTISSPVTGDAGSYLVTVSNSVGSVNSNSVTLIVDAAPLAPTITTSPAATTVNQGATATFTVTATGVPTSFTYQWKKDGTDIIGATSGTLAIANAQPADEGSYAVVVSNGVGSPATSTGAALTVNTAPVIGTQPIDSTVLAGATATFTAAATGKPTPTYKWQRKPAGQTAFADLTASSIYGNVTTATLTVTGATFAMNGDQFRCVATNSVTSTNTTAATLNVQIAPAITTAPVAATVNQGQAATFTVAVASNPTATYQWQRQPAGQTGFANLANDATYGGVTTATLTVTGTTFAMNGDQFQVVVTNGLTPDATSTPVALTVQTAPAISTPPVNATVTATGNATFTVAATGNPAPTFQWQRQPTGQTTFANLANGGAYSGATTATLTVTGATAVMNGDQFRCIAHNVVSPDATSSAATLTVNSAVAITTQPTAVSKNVGQSASFSVTATGNPAPAYQWMKGTTALGDGGTISGSTTNTLTVSAVALGDAASYSVVVTNTTINGTVNTPNTVTSSAVALTVYDPAAITVQPAPQTAVAGTIVSTPGVSATFTVTATGTPAPTYQWKRGSANIAGATGATLTVNNLTLADNGAQFSVVVTNVPAGNSALGGTATSTAATLTVNPTAPVITSALSALAVQNSNFLYQITTNATTISTNGFGATGLTGTGLSLNAATGVISGKPTAAGSIGVTLTASNVAGTTTQTDTKTLTITVNPPPPTVTSTPAPKGTVGTAGYNYTVTASNGATFTAAGLPPGLTITTGGVISGNPTQAGTYAVDITATNPTGSVTTQVMITIDPAPAAPVYAGTTGLSGTQGSSFSFTPVFTNNVTGYSITAGALPAGVTLSATTGAIAGNPTVTGTFAFTLTATGSGGATAVPFTLTVNPAPAAPVLTLAKATDTATVGVAYNPTAVAPTAVAVPSTGLTFTATWTPSGSTTSSSTPPAGFTFSSTTGAIGGTPAATSVGTYTVRIKAANTAGTGPEVVLVITVNPSPNAPIITSIPIVQGQVGVALAGYQLTTSPAATSATSFSITSSAPPAWLSLNTSSGLVTGTPDTVGQVRVVFAAADATNGQGLGLEVLFNIAPAVTAPVVNSNGTAAGQVGQPFQYAITAASSTAITGYAVTGTLPAGLQLDPGGSGVISGIPSTATTTPISVALTATNAGGTSNPKTLIITIAAPPATPVITSALTLSGQVGTAFTATTYQTTASANPTSFLAIGLPAGLTINSTTGAITGTPTVAGTFSATLRAANAGGLGAPSTLAVTIVSAVAAPSITSAAATTGQVGVAFTYTIVASPGPITGFGLTGTRTPPLDPLPLGLTFNSTTGVIVGKPAESGLFVVNLTATNAGGTSLPQQLVLGINPALGVPVVTSAMYVVAQVGTAFVVTPPTYQITATNMPASTPYAPPNELMAVNLPPGLAVNPANGVIQGTPTTAGTYTASLVGTNAAGSGALRDLTFFVQPALAAPVITSTPTAAAQVGAVTPFAYTITASNNPTSFELLNAPAWMTLNSQSGVVGGTPATPGTFTVQMTASNAAGTSNPAVLTIAVAPAAGTPIITSSRTVFGNVGVAFTYTLAATGAPITSYVATGLPAGLALNSATGVISGTPTASGSFPVTLIAANASGVGAPVTLVIVIQPNMTLNH